MALTILDLEEIEKLMDEKFDEKLSILPTKDDFFMKMDGAMSEFRGYSWAKY
ncbi:MAG TPA: hypothetical protein VJ227_00120 [Patescibacteria group bacterium]|nr:hypothetical protein [Patescibacteria group bacterium]